jgi:hypothetical protein
VTPSVSSSARDRSHEMNTEITTKTRPRKLRSANKPNTPIRSYDMYGMVHLLVQEHMSRARMPKPQSTSEASRPARQIAMMSRREQRRVMGNW